MPVDTVPRKKVRNQPVKLTEKQLENLDNYKSELPTKGVKSYQYLLETKLPFTCQTNKTTHTIRYRVECRDPKELEAAFEKLRETPYKNNISRGTNYVPYRKQGNGTRQGGFR